MPELFSLIQHHKNNEVKAYLDLHPDHISLKSSDNETPLFIAVDFENYEIACLLIERGVDINHKGISRYTAASLAKSVKMAQLLLDNGAILQYCELEWVTNRDYWEIIDLYLQHNAKIDPSEPQYFDCRSLEALKVYEKHGIDLNGKNMYGTTLLHRLAKDTTIEAFDYAFKKGVIWHKNQYGKTPYFSSKEGPPPNTEKFRHYFETSHKEYASFKIRPMSIQDIHTLSFIDITCITKIEGVANQYLVLYRNSEIIKYEIINNTFCPIQGIETDIPCIYNFTMNVEGQLIVPTLCPILLVIDPHTLELIEEKTFEMITGFRQITYLPKRKVYLTETTGECILILDSNFTILRDNQYFDEDTFFLVVSENENLLLAYGFNINFLCCTYELEDDFTIRYLEWFHTMNETKFLTDATLSGSEQLCIAGGKVVESSFVENGKLKTRWRKEFDSYIRSVIYVGKDTIAVQKQKQIALLNAKDGSLINELDIELPTHEGMYYDSYSNNLIVLTRNSLIPISLSSF
ncbi:hypothetical protein QNI19_36965 [Cytophagaceae bacterium DM2B3-1]|uniref:Ankyrin repeat domain-containing protein n=1 Tax=Xanthocytophaga flava TaxID=3048013 RepID=A0ABT7CXT6_9BACT|nr:hypothetical protein [Xanthocytophaga flavus]MDJ1498585.1 hypothetical protein [Xanthocytophaga flavus]